MFEDWSAFLKLYRVRHRLTQVHLAAVLGVAPRAVSAWERRKDEPPPPTQRLLRDLASHPDAYLSWKLFAAIRDCPLPRALSRTPNLRLQALSQPAICKRPSVVDWLGRDMTKIAHGVLAEMLDDGALQNAIVKGEIFCVFAVTQSVLRTSETPQIGTYRTTISYFFHEGTVYSDAVSVAAPSDAVCGYRFIPMDGATTP